MNLGPKSQQPKLYLLSYHRCPPQVQLSHFSGKLSRQPALLVFQELSSTFARMCHLVDETMAELKENTVNIDRTLKQLQEVTVKSKELRGKSAAIEHKLASFEQHYLRDKFE